MANESDLPPLVRHLPPAPDPEALLDGFVNYVNEQGISLYDAQENAILELLGGSNVILNTPTGSGKSLVAAAAHYVGLADDRRSFYTAPIKALVSEKFFSLCRDFGSDRVGMITGDASVNPDAPIICCTAEILANRALRDGAETDVDVVIMDEFHYYSDPQRGWAWQIPILELPNAQFLLMSATLGQTERFQTELTNRTGRPTELVSSASRPVPLKFEYRKTNLHTSVSELLETDRAPIYLVHFTQREATEAAQGYLSIDPLTKQEKQQVKDAIGGFKFDSPIGADLRRYVLGGIGVHHAGLLPKYRLLMEKLAQDGLLKIISGTDTLGVGVNVPIRSVLFTQLCKYDGRSTRLLTNREFAQIAGRAGRKGFDSVGHVWVQAPAHVVENTRSEEKAAAAKASNKRRKVVKKKPPERGYSHWNEDTFNRMKSGAPEALVSSFQVNHQMVMSLLDRPGDGCGAVRQLLTDNHETRTRQRRHIRRAISIYRSLLDADLLEILDEPDNEGRMVRVMLDLQDEFALHQPLSLWAIEAIEQLDPANPDHELSVLSVVESVLESPGVIIAAQVELARKTLLGELKAKGVEYEERMDRLAEVEPPRPNKEWIFESFDRFRANHPWVGSSNVAPKSIVRDMYERVMTFKEFVGFYGLKRSEGVVLRYLSDTYKALIQNIPDDDKTDEIVDITEWLGEVVRQVDSSLLDEWDRLRNPEADDSSDTSPSHPLDSSAEHNVTANPRAFRVMVRTESFRWVNSIALGRLAELELDDDQRTAIETAVAEFADEYGDMMIDAEARSPHRFIYDPAKQSVLQILSDRDNIDEWRLRFEVDVDRSAQQGRAVLMFKAMARAGDPSLE